MNDDVHLLVDKTGGFNGLPAGKAANTFYGRCGAAVSVGASGSKPASFTAWRSTVTCQGCLGGA